MTAMPAAQAMTAREFLELGEDPFGRRALLVEGELVLNEADLAHQRVVARLFVALTKWVEAGPGRGEVALPLDVLIDDRNVYAPDVHWYSKADLPAGDVLESPLLPGFALALDGLF